ncbi:MFS transporter [Sporosarcina sp. Te-1]|uniref:MFS transporter n=1 Tax=Sporosarcina sp. Te-1 TaxID=2818390 RepID=UPI001A9E5AC2|nr:MFS transporter [Sporosarcina sp. Te-1]QTD42102.1 MFS transporter [Sporosarcina sp. Te-1]
MKHRSFRFLWVSQAIADCGDTFYIVGLIAILYSQSSSPFVLALVPFVNMMGRFVSGFLSPLLMNRFSLKRLLVTSQTLKTFMLGSLACYAAGPAASVAVLLSLVFVIAFLDGWAAPASHAMLPRLVPKEELVKANSFFSVVSESVNLGAWAAGGLIVAMTTGPFIILLTGILYLFTIALLAGISDPVKFSPRKEERRSTELLAGWRLVWKCPLYRTLHILIAFDALANVVWIASILYVFVMEVLAKNEAWWGYINTSFFIGMLVGGIICSRFAPFLEQSLRRAILVSSFGIGLLTALFGMAAWPWFALVLAGCIGVFQQWKGISIHTSLQKVASAEELPTIYAVQQTIVSILFAAGSLAFGAFAELAGARPVYMLAAVLLALSTLYAWRYRRHLQTN